MSRRDIEFTSYVAEHRRRLVRAAFLLCGNWTQAEDVTQISLAKLYVAWPWIIRSRGPDAYVRRIITRTVVDESRRPWRRELLTGNGFDDAAAEKGVSDAPVDRDLASALLRLPLRQRQTVVLRHYWGLSIQETSALLGVSTGSVKSHCSRGLHRLNELLEPLSEEATDR